MSPLAFVLGLITVATSARTQAHGVPVLWLLAAALVLATAAALLVFARQMVREWRPAPAGAGAL